MEKSKPQAFNDGLLIVYDVVNTAAAGEMPVEGAKELERLHYHRRTVGVQRQYLAMQAGSRVDLLLRCRLRPKVRAGCVAVPSLDGHQYKVVAVQVPEDIRPPVMDLTLERLETEYGVGI